MYETVQLSLFFFFFGQVINNPKSQIYQSTSNNALSLSLRPPSVFSSYL